MSFMSVEIQHVYIKGHRFAKENYTISPVPPRKYCYYLASASECPSQRIVKIVKDSTNTD